MVRNNGDNRGRGRKIIASRCKIVGADANGIGKDGVSQKEEKGNGSGKILKHTRGMLQCWG